MNKTATKFSNARRVFTNLAYIHVTPWENETTLGDITYDLVDIVGDSTSVEQEDNEVNEIEHEFSNEPLYENVTLGKRTFTTECVDFRNEVLEQLFGWETDEAGNAYAPTGYRDLYCAIEFGFNSTDDVIVLPKVKLNSKAVLASMKTDASKGTISGTCYKANITIGDKTVETDMAAISAASKDAYAIAD